MINIVFDGITTGSLRITKDPETGEYIRRKDILFFEWMLDIGYLRDGVESEYRKELPGKLIMQGWYGKAGEGGIPEIGEENIRNWYTLIKRLEAGESVRVWYGNRPEALCGLFHVCTLLQKYENDVFAMCAPKYVKVRKNWYLNNSWGAVDQTSIGEYFGLQRLMEKIEIRLYAERWIELVKEDAPLRAVISGFPISVDEDFYDRFIEHNLPRKPIRESELVGNTMGMYDLGVSSSWLESRVQKMIDTGKIKVVVDSEEKAMQRILQKC